MPTEHKENSMWIKEEIGSLKNWYEKCVETEDEALASYVMCLIRLLNNLVQIEQATLHRYEAQILVQPMRLFSKYFEKEVQNILELSNDDIARKEEKIEDIEEAICRVADIYENVLNGTANTDSQMFLSVPINSSVYSLPPQLYARYSEMIQNLTIAFDDDGSYEVKYAFFLNPTMSRRLWAELLFKKREKPGKVIIIDIPVRILEEHKNLSIYIIHEMFHVLTAKQRNRPARAAVLAEHAVRQVGLRIFEKVDLDNGIKKKLISKWFQNVGKVVKEVLEENKKRHLEDGVNEIDSKDLYARNISRLLEEKIIEDLLNVKENLYSDLLKYLKDHENQKKRGEFLRFYNFNEQIITAEKRILANINNMLQQRTVNYILDRMIFIFKETYADVACLTIVPDISLNDYENAFRSSMQYMVDQDQFNEDTNRLYRQSLVETVVSYGLSEDEDLLEWAGIQYEKYREKLHRIQMKEREGEEVEKEMSTVNTGATNGRGLSKSFLTEEMYIDYVQYLWKCREDLQEVVDKLKEGENKERQNKWFEFSKLIKLFIRGNTLEVLYGENSVSEE